MSYLEEYAAQCKVFEGCVGWMYLDTVGKVTVGVGNMLPDVTAALMLPLRSQSSGDLAGAPAVIRDYARVQGLREGMAARAYWEYEALVLAPEDIEELLMRRLDEFDETLRRDFGGYDGYPDAVKMALLDMIYNLGEGKLMRTYPGFDAAVRAKDWPQAAAECHRNGPSDARNEWTKQQFLAAV
jgi:GH24 family phage-related lysozyme (muramidase)